MGSASKPGTNSAFIEKQRLRLVRLRADLADASRAAEAEEADIKAQRSAEALEQEDDAQGLDALEREGNFVVRDVERMAQVERALKKIEDGTYGLSDLSGKQIATERLEAVPEAIYTLAEQEKLDGRRPK
jgi:DnaK suppressor protein